jgi:predicted MFS family arabinose efflux permease
VVTALATLLTAREPKRGGLDVGVISAPANAEPPGSSFWRTVTMFFSRPSLVLVAVASGATQMVTYGSLNFTTLFLMREKGMTLKQVALYYALLIGIGMSAGIFVSGRVTASPTDPSKPTP